jgi:hypothetical protein
MARRAPPRGGEGGISLSAVRATEQRPPALARGAGSAPPADRGSEAGAPSARLRGRARRFEDLEGREFEELVLNTAARILARHQGNVATLRPVQVLEETGLKAAVVYYSTVEDILLHHPDIGDWKLARVERRDGRFVYFRYVRVRVRCPVCGKLLQRRSLPSHAFGHIERLVRQGVIRLERTDGRWFIVLSDGRKLYGASWLTLVKLIELGVVNSG